MSKDNREECPDCKGKGYYYQESPDCSTCFENDNCSWSVDNRCVVETGCETCNGTGEVTIDSGADVCEWEKDSYCNEYLSDCDYCMDIDMEIPERIIISFKYCPYCGKPITIKG